MPTVEFDREKTVEVDDPDLTLLEIAREAGIASFTCRVTDHPDRGVPISRSRRELPDLLAQSAQVEATIIQDERDLERKKKLLAENLATTADVEKLDTQLKLDRARLTGRCADLGAGAG